MKLMRSFLVPLLVVLGQGCGSSGENPLPGPGTGGTGTGGAKTGGSAATAGGSGPSAGGSVTTTGGNSSTTGGTSSSGGSKATGGSTTTGGTSPATGGKASGGTQSGGTATGGSTTTTGGTSSNSGGTTATSGGTTATSGGTTATSGGTSGTTGGKAAGGSSSGGTGSGGKASGGTSSGGAATGGAATGGAVTGGASTGGTATGGTAAGGTAAGGTATGGTATGGSSGTCTPPTPGSKGTNPLFTDQYTADPAALVFNCKFYITCGHDEGSTGFVMREWFLLTSTDMVNWTKKVAMNLSVFKWAYSNAWAGQMVTKNGKFYWYVPVAEGANGAMAIGVAVADSPDGPFTDAIGKPLVNDQFEIDKMGYASPEKTPFTIDPTVFVDSDGSAYLHYGGFQTMVAAKLGDDMISLVEWKEATPPGFFESAYLIKRNNLFYEIYADGINPPFISYSTSPNYNGPWTKRGTILPKMETLAGQDAATNHAGVAEFAGQWYIVYHRSNGPNGGGTYKREVAIDKMNFNADGTIQAVTPTDGLSF